MQPDDPAARLERALDDMRMAILTGNLPALGPLTGEAEQVVASLAQISDRTIFQRLHRKAQRNLVCLDAASRGLRSARLRLAEIQAAAAGKLVTYDESGKRAETPKHQTPLHRF